jgi:hypothetical protein
LRFGGHIAGIPQGLHSDSRKRDRKPVGIPALRNKFKIYADTQTKSKWTTFTKAWRILGAADEGFDLQILRVLVNEHFEQLTEGCIPLGNWKWVNKSSSLFENGK